MCKKAACDSCRKYLQYNPALHISLPMDHFMIQWRYITAPRASRVNVDMFADKTTWWGCGKHVAGVMSNVPVEQWCTCGPQVEQQGQKYPPMGSLSSA